MDAGPGIVYHGGHLVRIVFLSLKKYFVEGLQQQELAARIKIKDSRCQMGSFRMIRI